MENPPEDFALNIYRGCVLPEDAKPIRQTSWGTWILENPEDFNEFQLELIKRKMIEGKSWVCFSKKLETISAPDYYKPLDHIRNPIQPKERLI